MHTHMEKVTSLLVKIVLGRIVKNKVAEIVLAGLSTKIVKIFLNSQKNMATRPPDQFFPMICRIIFQELLGCFEKNFAPKV